MAKHAGTRAFLLTGGNLGDRESTLAEALRAIGTNCGQVIRTSGLYETAAWGLAGQPDFLNQVIEIRTMLSPAVLLNRVLGIEQRLGRVRKTKNGPRLIDIDILLYGETIVNEPDLTIPHPEMTRRRFVLTPMAEIAPEMVHPVLQKTMKQLLLDCTDPLAVTFIAQRNLS